MDEPIQILAGTGGVALGEARTNHEGRKAILLYRDGNPAELIGLAETMGIEIIELVNQKGRDDVKTYFGKGRLQDVADELSGSLSGHKWHGVDLVILHTNASPRQLVNIHENVQVEVWDRVRLLLSLFISHANSVEARTQVRIAQLQADRTVLRELANQQTTGERAGFGAGGKQAIQGVLTTVSRELTQLNKRQQKHARARKERRRQRIRGGAKTVGLAGYTNAGKSSLFLKLSGKEVLVEDKLFSTLETTVGRMEMSPRILLADTIGFIDELPSDLLDAFHATLDESLECDLLLLLVDSSDNIDELKRKLSTSRREIFDRMEALPPKIKLVLTKSDNMQDLEEALDYVNTIGMQDPIVISSHTEHGIADLRQCILESLYGGETSVYVADDENSTVSSESLISKIYNLGIVTNRHGNELVIWCDRGELNRLISKSNGRISIK
ncbi:MAG: GTPase HflX [Euryarchaeota archaeon]|nr:GTPase HflX [Euryarchaeota archaeon]